MFLSSYLYRFNRDVNQNLSAHALFRFANRWFVFRIDILGITCIMITAAACVAFKSASSPAKAGLALANVFQATSILPFVSRIVSELRARFTSVERVCEYAYEIDQEAQKKDENKKLENWPSNGEVIFDKVTFGYKQTIGVVLDQISFKLTPGMKVGIVGRTGAGKTSLLASILRLNELSGGKILIDGLDVSQISLTKLRSSIAVIPQDPVLFRGTIRHNLDPFNTYPDDKIWSCLEKAHLKDKLASEDSEGLSMHVGVDGDNFSVGEKQLICLSRALLRGNKILLLDEATASVDVKTDHLIQSTIQEVFKDCTVMTIAHRLQTVMNYDMILVLDKGMLVESGSPEDLASRPNGIFKSMLEATKMKLRQKPQ